MRVLVVEDEDRLARAIARGMEADGIAVDVAHDGEEGLRHATERAYDVITLDVMLPRRNGFDVCRDLRAQGVRTPVLMLTARGQIEDKVVGLKLGADDYLVKPFHMSELVARVEALLRRGGPAPAPAPGGRPVRTPTRDVQEVPRHVLQRPVH